MVVVLVVVMLVELVVVAVVVRVVVVTIVTAMALGQMFFYLHTRLHFFQLISHVIKPPRCNFLLSYIDIYAYFEPYPFLDTYLRFSPSEMHDFSLRDLHTFHLPP